MKDIRSKHGLIIIWIMCSWACSSTKETITGQSGYWTAVVKDYTGLDGCGKILILDSGIKILPLNAEVLNPYHKDDQVMIRFEKMSGIVSTCMAEDFIADIKSIKTVDDNKMTRTCQPVSHIDQLDWASKLSQDHKLKQAEQYKTQSGDWQYLFRWFNGETKLFDCQGKVLHSFDHKQYKKQLTALNHLELVSLIYQSKYLQK